MIQFGPDFTLRQGESIVSLGVTVCDHQPLWSKKGEAPPPHSISGLLRRVTVLRVRRVLCPTFLPVEDDHAGWGPEPRGCVFVPVRGSSQAASGQGGGLQLLFM